MRKLLLAVLYLDTPNLLVKNLEILKALTSERRKKRIIGFSICIFSSFPQFVSSSILPDTGKDERTAVGLLYFPFNQERNKLQLESNLPFRRWRVLSFPPAL